MSNTYGTCGSCVYGTPGCTDPNASNYDPNATTDDGSCTYCDQAVVNFSVDAGAVVSSSYDNVVINGNFSNWNGWGVTLTDADGDGVYEGSLTVDAGTYEYVHALTGSGDGWSGWGVIGNAPTACQVPGTGNYGFTVNCGDTLTLPTVCFASCDPCAVPGCTDINATNYDPNATTDDGSCTYPDCNGIANGLAMIDDCGDCQSALVYDYVTHVAMPILDTTGYVFGSTEMLVLPNDPMNTYWNSSFCKCTDVNATNYDSTTIDDGSCAYPILTITTTVCDGASSVVMTGPWWNWDPNSGPVAVDNGDSTFTFTFDPAPTADMEYLLIVDGVQEDLTAANTASGDWSCTPITDYWSYANRLWVVGSGDVSNTYGTCGSCVYGTPGCTDPNASNYDPNATTDDGSCTYCDQAVVNFSVDGSCCFIFL